MSWTNFHTHTTFCDGHAEPVVFVEAALEQQVSVLGFSSHAPVSFINRWTMNPLRLRDYVAEIHRLKNLYAGQIDLHCGLEVDYFPDVLTSCQALYEEVPLDYKIGAVHFIGTYPDGMHWCIDGPNDVFRQGLDTLLGGDSHAAVARYFSYHRTMVKEMQVDVVAHFDKIKIQYRPDGCGLPESDPFYARELMQTLEAFKEIGSIVEISTRGLAKGTITDFYPSAWVVKEMFRMGIPVTLNSDAHRPGDITGFFEQAAAFLYETGYRELMVLRDGVWQPVSFSPAGLLI